MECVNAWEGKVLLPASAMGQRRGGGAWLSCLVLNLFIFYSNNEFMAGYSGSSL
jgi:hypothetical protein